LIPLPAALKNWKAEEGQTSPVAVLYDISVTDTITLRLVEGNPIGAAITYNGNVYAPAAIRREDVDQSIEGEIGSFRISVSNIDGIAGGYIEKYDLDGRRVTITTVPVSTLLPADAFVETYTIQDQAYTREAASVTLGYSNLFKRKIPWRKYQRLRCLWDYENRFTVGNGCAYPSDEFEDDTTQDLSIGAQGDGEQGRLYGWSTLNAPSASRFNVNIDVLGELFIESSSSDIDWAGSNRNGPYLYKKISGNFDCYTQVIPKDFRSSGLLGLLCQDDGGPQDSWVFLARTRDDGDEIRIVSTASIDGSVEVTTVVEDPNPRYLRMRRVGDVFSLYYSATENTNWTLIQDRTVEMNQGIRIGLAIGGGQGLVLAATFPYLRFTSGGLGTCDRTADGPDGCRVHKNLHRIFLFQGIPRR
jgi:phage-related protein